MREWDVWVPVVVCIARWRSHRGHAGVMGRAEAKHYRKWNGSQGRRCHVWRHLSGWRCPCVDIPCWRCPCVDIPCDGVTKKFHSIESGPALSSHERKQERVHCGWAVCLVTPKEHKRKAHSTTQMFYLIFFSKT